MGACREPLRVVGVTPVLFQAGSVVHGEVRCSLHSLPTTGKVSLPWAAHTWGRRDGGNVNLSFLHSSMNLLLFLSFTKVS